MDMVGKDMVGKDMVWYGNTTNGECSFVSDDGGH